jgi:CheY-like chemotaxis protein
MVKRLCVLHFFYVIISPIILALTLDNDLEKHKKLKMFQRKKKDRNRIKNQRLLAQILCIWCCFFYEIDPVNASDINRSLQETSQMMPEKQGDWSSDIPAANRGNVWLNEAERSWLKLHPVIRVVQDPGWPPIEFTDPDGELSGMSNDILKLMEERLGYKILAADRPGLALEMARTYAGRIHLLITDVVMPEMNGRDLALQMTALYPHIELLFMSGYTANVIAHQGVLDKGVEFIQKPFPIKDLAVKVRKVLDKK